MKSIASLSQISRNASADQLADQLDAIESAIADLERARRVVEALYEAAGAREYAEAAAFEARDWEAPGRYVDVRGF